MSDWQPLCPADVAAQRADLLARARSYFTERGVLAVDTPALGLAGVTDPHIDCYRTADGDWLQTSPEYYMKRLLAAGYPDIYSICRVFRDGERGTLHLPEFTMIEWYRHGMHLDAIIDDTLGLVGHVLNLRLTPENVPVYEYYALFNDIVGIDVKTCTIDDVAEAASVDDSLRAALGSDIDAWLDLILTTKISPRLPAEKFTVVQHYPTSQAALARVCPANPTVADRFEIFFGNVELANGYVELTDATEQARRMAIDNSNRRRLGKPEQPHDERLLAAIETGLPHCAGVALGFERLHMIAGNASDIRDVVTFAET
ncbi:MAG: EF-P lysine aminoacylase GenX [Woeseiaceae bacterium]|nr:EF-P lysine aminoacylase GenX [Woeseiaceae bacterium]